MVAAPPPRESPSAAAPQPAVGSTPRQQVLIDLHKRAEGGIPVHIAAWLLVVGGSGIYATNKALVIAVGALFTVTAIARLLLRPRFASLVERRYRLAHHLFMTLLLSNGSLWGLLAGLSLLWAPLMPAHDLIRLVTFATCAGGTMSLALLPIVRVGMPLLMMAPLVIALVVGMTIDGLFMALMTMVFLGYISKASRAVEGDYWAAVDAGTLLAERAAELERLSVTDALTQVHNRLYFDARMAEEWMRAQREGEPLTVLLLDLDHFKAINDTHSHLVGDRCLREVAAAVQRVLFRPGDVLARYGGEEFVVLLARTPAEAGQCVAERLRLCVKSLVIEAPQGVLSLSCSIGYATAVPLRGSDWSGLLARADAAMYAAKAQGRDQVSVAIAGLQEAAADPKHVSAASG